MVSYDPFAIGVAHWLLVAVGKLTTIPHEGYIIPASVGYFKPVVDYLQIMSELLLARRELRIVSK